MSVRSVLLWIGALALVSTEVGAEDRFVDLPDIALSPELAATQVGPFPKTFRFATNWLFHPGDDPSFARPELDDEAWVRLDSLGTLLPPVSQARIGWNGIGWFRLHLNVPPGMRERQLALVWLQSGAADVFVDGERILSVGTVGSPRKTERVYVSLERGKLTPLRFGSGAEHVLAVRYSNFWALDNPPDDEFEPGFDMGLAELEDAIESRLTAMRIISIQQAFAAVPLSFAVLHLLVFFFYRKLRGHLYFALFAASVAALIYTPLHGASTVDPGVHVYYAQLFRVSIVSTVVSGLRFLYHEIAGALPRYFWVASGVGLVMVVLMSIIPEDWYLYYFVIFFLPGILRLTYVGIRRRVPGAGIITLGWVVFAAGGTWQVLIHTQLLPDLEWFPYIQGTLLLLLSMSAHLARDVARTNRDLEAQLAQVQELSEEALAQERRARQEALAREHLEAENALKTAELEAARERQKVLDELEETNVELRRTQAQLVHSAKMAALGNMVAGITHEINSPIGAIRSTVDTLGRAASRLRDALGPKFLHETDEDAGVGKAFDVIATSNHVIAEAIERVTGIVRNLRNFARLDEAEFLVADLQEGLESTLAVMATEIGDGISVVREYGDIAPIYCSPGQLNQVFMHLMKNAVQAMVGSGQLAISTSQDEDRVHIRLRDTGTGMPPEQVEHIFDFTFRSGGTRVKMGLGLVADYNIVQDHDGEMEIRSEVGVGTEVRVSLPRRESNDA